MKEFINAFDNLPLIVKIILAIPALDIIWSIYRVVRALDEKNIFALIVAIIFFLVPITWIFDIICIVMKGNVWYFRSAK